MPWHHCNIDNKYNFNKKNQKYIKQQNLSIVCVCILDFISLCKVSPDWLHALKKNDQVKNILGCWLLENKVCDSNGMEFTNRGL